MMDLNSRIEILVKYLLMKADQGDWHAVSDAANDLRELEIERKFHDNSR